VATITSLQTRAGWSLLWATVRPHRRDLVRLLLWSVVEAVPALFSGALVARALDRGFLAGDFGAGALFLGCYAAIIMVGGFGSRQAVLPLARIVESMRFDLISRTVTAILARGVRGEAVDGRGVEGATKHTDILRMLFSQLLTVLRTAIFSLVFVIIGLFSLAPVVAWVAVGSALLAVGALVLTAGRWQRLIRDSLLAEERLSGDAGDAVLGLRDVVACGAMDRASRDLVADVEAHARSAGLVGRAVSARVAVLALGGRLPLAVLLVTAPFAISSHTLTPGELVGAATYLIGNLDPVLRAIVRVVGDIGLQIGVLLARIHEYARLPEPVAAPGGARPGGGALSLRGVSFGYSASSEPILDRVDLAVPAGERLVVVGPSGAGKSTLANLVAGLDRPQAGRLSVGGADLAALDPACLRATITLLPQEAYVFSGSVRENLVYLNPEATDEELLRACREVGSAELVRERGGLAARIGSPNELSEGQKQLITLTRAYLSPSDIVVLDEATCHLHPERERQAEDAFAATGRTLIIIAHRMSSAMRADRVVLLHGGGLDVGTHQELCATSPLYADLVGYWNES
jgi:ATP-binding cassette, subfamily B, bacterial RamB/AmfA